jgi:hypothetical protein
MPYSRGTPPTNTILPPAWINLYPPHTTEKKEKRRSKKTSSPQKEKKINK